LGRSAGGDVHRGIPGSSGTARKDQPRRFQVRLNLADMLRSKVMAAAPKCFQLMGEPLYFGLEFAHQQRAKPVPDCIIDALDTPSDKIIDGADAGPQLSRQFTARIGDRFTAVTFAAFKALSDRY
jgi:hypothetical protein